MGVRSNNAGTIYVLQVGEYTKIGFSEDIARRRRAYLAHNPFTPEFSHTEPGIFAEEKRAQAILKQRRPPGRRVDLDWYEGLTLYDAMKTIAIAKRQIAEEASLGPTQLVGHQATAGRRMPARGSE